MEIRYNLEKIKAIVTNLSIAFDASMAIYDEAGHTLFRRFKENETFCDELQRRQQGRAKCHCCDTALLKKCAETGKPQSHVCHAGLIDTAIPLIKDSLTVGYLIIGRIRPTRELPESIVRRLHWHSADLPLLQEQYRTLAYFTQEQLDALIALVNQIFIESAICIEYTDVLASAVAYIDSHLRQPITVSQLCTQCYVSKNRLYALFHDNFHTTVKDFIVERKLNLAKQLLLDTQMPIKDVAEAVSLGDHTYFCKLFKKRTGMSAKEYRCFVTSGNP